MIQERGTILMLHRIAPYEREPVTPNENLKISPDELERVIKELIQMKKVFISLDELYEIHRKNIKLNNKFVVFTLDDGYTDNLDYGLPVFEKFNIPVCIYITNSFPNRTTGLWWYALEKLIINNNTLRISPNRSITNTTKEERFKNFLSIRENILSQEFLDPLSYLHQVGEFDFDLHKEMEDKCLSWAQIELLSQHPLVTIGCHTMNHLPLKNLSADDVYREIADSRKELEMKLKTKIDHFAYPFGSKREVGRREYNIAQTFNFKTVTTTVNSHIYPEDSLQKLNRIYVKPLDANGTSLRYIMNSDPRIYINRLRNILT